MGLLSAFVERLRRMIQSTQEFTLFGVVTSIVAGQALALQLVRELATSGAKSQLGHFQVISVVRALGPILTGMVVAARMSAGITAEIGAMRSSDQIDALVAFGSDPMKRLVVPRLVALLAALPVLVIIADTLGVLGGALVGMQYHLTWETYMNGVFKYLTPENLLVGMIKPFIFAIMIVIVACSNFETWIIRSRIDESSPASPSRFGEARLG